MKCKKKISDNYEKNDQDKDVRNVETKIDEIFYFKLGNELDLKRKKLGYSYRYLASLTGISRNQLDKYMSGKQRIKKDTYEIICRALEIDSKINIELSIG
jgi:predicted transcriptional regulator